MCSDIGSFSHFQLLDASELQCLLQGPPDTAVNLDIERSDGRTLSLRLLRRGEAAPSIGLANFKPNDLQSRTKLSSAKGPVNTLNTSPSPAQSPSGDHVKQMQDPVAQSKSKEKTIVSPSQAASPAQSTNDSERMRSLQVRERENELMTSVALARHQVKKKESESSKQQVHKFLCAKNCEFGLD